MKLHILGTAGQLPTRTRSQNAYFLDWPYGGVLFDPGEGAQRQFTFAGISPGRIHKIFISHFHGDHCLGLPGIMQRLSLMELKHEVHIYFPEEGRPYFDALSIASKYTHRINFHLHPIHEGAVEETEDYRIEAYDLLHSTPTLGYRFIDKSRMRFRKELLEEMHLYGPILGELERNGKIKHQGKTITRDELSYYSDEKIFAYVLDTGICDSIPKLIRNADLVLMEATYLGSEFALAEEFMHMTAEKAAEYAKNNNVKKLALTHFSERYKDLNLYQKAVEKTYKNTHISHDLDVIEF
ncbi:MAG: MBL fold metallo-hydrolase [Candidatus Marinimicrobia bacterium]|nr:MBL fold metallo-hydrolase [Candidatus Neomarinimicrobiota bacterium]